MWICLIHENLDHPLAVIIFVHSYISFFILFLPWAQCRQVGQSEGTTLPHPEPAAPLALCRLHTSLTTREQNLSLYEVLKHLLLSLGPDNNFLTGSLDCIYHFLCPFLFESEDTFALFHSCFTQSSVQNGADNHAYLPTCHLLWESFSGNNKGKKHETLGEYMLGPGLRCTSIVAILTATVRVGDDLLCCKGNYNSKDCKAQ